MDEWKSALFDFINVSVIAGIILATVGGMMTHFACALMKYAHVKNAEKQIEYQRVYFLDSRWLVCFGLFMLGLLFSFVSLYLVQMMIVVPLMSLGVWFGYQYTSWYNAQRIEKRDYVAYGIVVVGHLIFVTCSLKKNSHVGASSVADVFDRTLSFSNNAFLMTSYLILCCFAPFVFIVLNRFETFQRVYVSSTASSIMLLWGMVNSKIFPGFWAFATALPLVLIHVHILQTILTAYSYFAWLSIHQVMTTVISLLFAQLFFKEFPSGVLQILFILLGIAVQIVGLGLLVSEKVTRNSLMPQRSSNSYLLFNQLNYAFDSDEGSSLELHALGSDSDSDDNMDETSHRHDTILVMSSSSNNNNGGGSIPESQQPPQQQQQPNVVIIQNKRDVEDKQPTTPTTTTDTTTTTVVRLDDPLA